MEWNSFQIRMADSSHLGPVSNSPILQLNDMKFNCDKSRESDSEPYENVAADFLNKVHISY